jgi:hypothetical protein
VADDPSNAELGRRLDDLRIMVQGLVGRDVYKADRRAFDLQFAEAQADIAEGKQHHAELRRDLAEHIKHATESEGTSRRHWQTIILTGLLQAAISIVAVAVTVWLGRQ